MSLVDRAAKPQPPIVYGQPCSLGEIESAVAGDAAEKAALHRILYELGWSATQVFEALTGEGYSVGRQSINRHRGKKCRCYKDAA